jgi:multidrug efflux pump
MGFPEVFVRRPVGTTVLTLGAALAGMVAFFLLPVSLLPRVDLPTIVVEAWMAGATPEVMATSVAAPLERHLGQIADVSEMTSASYRGYMRVTLQFGLDRDIDGAARDVQAAINGARADLPTTLRSNPTYHKVNPAGPPVLVLALSSATRSPGAIYDAAFTVLQRKLSQVEGIGQVNLGGGSLPAVRVELNPNALSRYGIGLEDVRAALGAANAHAPKGVIEDDARRWQLYANDQLTAAAQYRSLVIAYRHGAPVRLSDVAEVVDGVEDVRSEGAADGRRAVLVMLYRQPGANIVDTVDRVKALLPYLRASIPADIDVTPMSDRTMTIRASLHDIERTLLLSIVLVVGVVFLFLRDARAALIPSVVLPVSLAMSFGAMYALGLGLDNLSLMALTIATGFILDDAIVVLENIMRHVETGMTPMQATLAGAREVGLTVVSMSVSLVAIFLPILLMGGMLGRIFREFALTVSIAVTASLVVSLTATPMMCAYLLRRRPHRRRRPPPPRLLQASGRLLGAARAFYGWSLDRALRHASLVLLGLFATLALTLYLFAIVPKGFLPQQDTGRLAGWIVADQSSSFQLERRKLYRFISILDHDPAVASAAGYTWGFVFVTLKPRSERALSADEVIERLRRALSVVPGARLYLQATQDFTIGGRQSNAQFQYTLLADNLGLLRRWVPRITEALQHDPAFVDVSDDQQDNGLASNLAIDRDTAARLGLSVSQIDNTLYDAFGQRLVSTIYAPQNQYHVVMEVAPRYWQSPHMLDELYVSTGGAPVRGTEATNAVAGTVAASSAAENAAGIAANTARNLSSNQIGTSGRYQASSATPVSTSAETMVPLSAVVRYEPGRTPVAVFHEGPFVATTISFNLPPGEALGEAAAEIGRVMARLDVPAAIRGGFAGTTKTFERSLAAEPLVALAAILTVYIVLGVLYESLVHPLTILSTLPSAGLGALLALDLLHTEFSLIALIGVILLTGIVMKNAIMMIDVALDIERSHGLGSREAVHHACLLRFRPIMMTTMAALLGALPLALGWGEGSELRRPLGIAIVGGLVVSQLLTLYTTPVIYLYLDRLRLWLGHTARHARPPDNALPRPD